jgi:hypothetical protein
MSSIRDKIDNMLASGRYSSTDIIAFAKPYGLHLNKVNVFKHNHRHRLVTVGEIEVTKATERARKNAEKHAEELTASGAFLQDVINRVARRIKTEKIVPTLNEGLKAAEIQIKLKGGSPVEDALLSFVEGLASRKEDE